MEPFTEEWWDHCLTNAPDASRIPATEIEVNELPPGPLAHRVEQGTFNPTVPGSSPGRPTKTTKGGEVDRRTIPRNKHDPALLQRVDDTTNDWEATPYQKLSDTQLGRLTKLLEVLGPEAVDSLRRQAGIGGY